MKAQPGSFDLQSSDRDLFDLLLAEEDIAESADAFPMKKHSLRSAPQSFSQGRLWFFEQMEPGRAIYNVPGGLCIEGILQIQSLFDALLEIVRRQESLRTSFGEAPDGSGQQRIEPVQSIYSQDSPYVPSLVDISSLSETERVETVSQLSDDEALRPFDLSIAPLHRASLIRSASHEHVMLITMHHIISDEWSLAVFLQELANLYSRFLRGSPSELNELTVQYSDYAVWQRESLQGEVLERQLDYWRAKLAGAPQSVELPLDRPRAVAPSYRGNTVSRELSVQISESLRALAREQGVTLFTLLLAAYEVLLFRYTGRADLVIGTPVAGRDRVETQELIGFFVNMLCVRGSLGACDTFAEVVRDLNRSMIESYGNQSLPFELLVQKIEAQRGTGRSSIFNVTFALEQGLPEVITMPGLTATTLYRETETAKFDLILSIIDMKQALTAGFEYASDLFDRSTIERMMGSLQVLLDGMTSGAEGIVQSLPLLTAAQNHQFLDEWNDTSANYSPSLCIHQLFENQVELSSDSVAVVFEEELITYLALNRRANRLAHHLRRRGITVGAIVGIRLERSVEMAAALLAIMKAGAAYLPLDPDYPAQRLEYMIDDSGAALIITEPALKDTMPSTRAEVLSINQIRQETNLESESNPETGVTPENLIYVIYTSGSTGTPKGTALPHKGPLNCILWLQDKFQFDQHDRLLMKASLSFDPSVWEIFWPLAVGATVIMVVPGGEQDSSYLLTAIARLQVTSCQFVPSMLRVFVDERNIKDAASLELAFSLGEALPVDTMAAFLDRFKAELHNFYGPTETSMGCMDWLCPPSWNRSNVPIGRPIANVREYILDNRLSPVPAGATGELCVAGEGVGFGYVRRSDLTADKFSPDLMSRHPGNRMYRTGDLCRYLHDGNIEFLGRIDHQVKIRGSRIELGEVEATLAGHQSISECLVTPRTDLGPDKRLVAYFVSRGGEKVSASTIRKFAVEKLPNFMVPAHFIQLNDWPLTVSGKIDRLALPRPDLIEIEVDEYNAPRGAVEELLANTWKEVLGIERVDRSASFFELGGHSLVGTQVVSRIRESFRLEVPLRRIFEHPVLSELAAAVAGMTGAVGPSGPIARAQRDGHAPLSHAQERLWFLDQLEPDRAVYNVVAGIRMAGSISVTAIEQGVTEIVRRHESLRTTFGTQDGELIQMVHPLVPDCETVIDVCNLDVAIRDDAIAALATIQASRPFDLKRGPLIKTCLFRGDSREFTLVVFMHHIVCDGWSMGLLTREITLLYRTFLAGAQLSLEDLSIQYADYALWHRSYVNRGLLSKQLEYWRSRLTDASASLELPFDRPRPIAQTFSGATVDFQVSADLAADLHLLARRQTATLFMVLLAAFQTLLHRYSGQGDISVGSPISNRTRKEIESLIGFFANTLVLRAQFGTRESFRQLLWKTRATTLEAYAHQDLPFEMLVEALKPVRDLSRSPLFQVLFVLQNAPFDELTLPAVEIQPIKLDAGRAHFDLTLAMMEVEGALQASIEFNTDLFDHATISRLFGHFEVLLRSISVNPDCLVSELPLLTEAERFQLLLEFNSTQREFDQNAPVHYLFERQAADTPDAVSVVFESSHLTYQRLDIEATTLAARLQSLGAGPDVAVGVCMDRSVEMVSGVIGILKAGGAYVPLDPAYPADRLAAMAESVDILITQTHRLEGLLVRLGRVLCHDSTGSGPGAESGPVSHERRALTLPENLCYVVHTSGSTGKPKGVAMSHGAAVKMISWQAASGTQIECCRTLQFASLSFDVSFQEIFSTLSGGGTLVLISDESRKDPARLLHSILSEQVERIFIPVVVLQQIAEAAGNDSRLSLPLR